jgi:aryl-alcohol dehydrogenase-like predicted oxidoreductase
MTVLTSDTNPEDQEAASLKTIATALELGVNLLDTAWIYQVEHYHSILSLVKLRY